MFPNPEDLEGLHPEYVDEIFAAIHAGVARWNGESLELVEP